MQGSSNGPVLFQLVVGLTSLFRGLGDQLNASLIECLADLSRYVHTAVGALTNHEQIGTSGKHRGKVLR